MVCYGIKHLVEADSQALRLNNNLFDFVPEQLRSFLPSGIGKCGNDSAYSGPCLKQSFVDEVCHDLRSGVGIYFEFSAKNPDRRKCVAGAKLTGNHGLL